MKETGTHRGLQRHVMNSSASQVPFFPWLVFISQNEQSQRLDRSQKAWSSLCNIHYRPSLEQFDNLYFIKGTGSKLFILDTWSYKCTSSQNYIVLPLAGETKKNRTKCLTKCQEMAGQQDIFGREFPSQFKGELLWQLISSLKSLDMELGEVFFLYIYK